MCTHRLTVRLQLKTQYFTQAAYGKCFKALSEQRGADPLAVEFARMLLAEGCLSTQRCFSVECDWAREKGFFSEQTLQDSCKYTLREAPFISYANLECTWLARDSRVLPGSGSMCRWFLVSKARVSFFSFLVHWVDLLRGIASFSNRMKETWMWLLMNLPFSSKHCFLLEAPCLVHLTQWELWLWHLSKLLSLCLKLYKAGLYPTYRKRFFREMRLHAVETYICKLIPHTCKCFIYDPIDSSHLLSLASVLKARETVTLHTFKAQ